MQFIWVEFTFTKRGEVHEKTDKKQHEVKNTVENIFVFLKLMSLLDLKETITGSALIYTLCTLCNMTNKRVYVQGGGAKYGPKG